MFSLCSVQELLCYALMFTFPGLYQTGEAYIIAGAVFVLVANVAVSFGKYSFTCVLCIYKTLFLIHLSFCCDHRDF